MLRADTETGPACVPIAGRWEPSTTGRRGSDGSTRAAPCGTTLGSGGLRLPPTSAGLAAPSLGRVTSAESSSPTRRAFDADAREADRTGADAPPTSG
jgi:hypothetical protein